jgi:hypothetical protein
MLSMIVPFAVWAQEESDFDYGVSMDLTSRYVWRGQALGGVAPNIQPGTYFAWKGLEVGAWGSYSLSQDPYAELDLYLSYTFWKERFTVIFTDYSFPSIESDFNYFDYKNNHVLELGFSYNGEEKVPIQVSFYANLFGADAKKMELVNGTQHEYQPTDKNVYSMYGEIAYNPTWEKLGVDFSVFVGMSLNGTKYEDFELADDFTPIYTWQPAGFYGNKGFGVVNLGFSATKKFEINKKLSIPISTSLIFNPVAKKAYLAASVGIAL